MAIDLGGAIGLVTGGANGIGAASRRTTRPRSPRSAASTGLLQRRSVHHQRLASRPDRGLVSDVCPGRTPESTFSQARGVHGNALRSRERRFESCLVHKIRTKLLTTSLPARLTDLHLYHESADSRPIRTPDRHTRGPVAVHSG